MTYSDFLSKLTSYAEEDFAVFQKKLIFTERKILGVRTPILRKLAQELSAELTSIFNFPDEYYETVFIQLAIVATLPYEHFLDYLPACIDRIDNWSLCDTFKAKCIAKRKRDFLPVLEKLFQKNGGYSMRYVLVSLLSFYVEKEYLPTLRSYLQRADNAFYYVHMASAWLTAEILIKQYDFGITLLKDNVLPPKTHNKSIQKAIESYRLTKKQKEYLRSLKIKL